MGLKADKLPVPLESTEQRNLFTWAAMQSAAWPQLRLLYHVPNSGYRTATEAARFRAEGVQPGVPDLCLPVARHGFHGLYTSSSSAGAAAGPVKSKSGGLPSCGMKDTARRSAAAGKRPRRTSWTI